MKSIRYLSILSLAILLSACQPATPASTTVKTDTEFTLVIHQSATLENTGISFQLTGIPSDARCPSEIECFASGSVTVNISTQKDSASPAEFTLQTFTDNDGRAPKGHFEGMTESVEYEGYVIQIKGVLPYPVKKFGEIKDSEYQVAFLITAK